VERWDVDALYRVAGKATSADDLAQLMEPLGLDSGRNGDDVFNRLTEATQRRPRGGSSSSSGGGGGTKGPDTERTRRSRMAGGNFSAASRPNQFGGLLGGTS
jgi:hypothetical protein